MAKVGFTPTDKQRSKRHIILNDCVDGDIVYLEDSQRFGLIIETDYNEKKVVDFEDGDCEWLSSETLCRKFVGEIKFNVDDFLEFI